MSSRRSARSLLAVLLLMPACTADRDLSLPVQPQPVRATVVQAAGVTATAVVDATWTEVFTEEFDGTLGKWQVWTGGAFNNELQYYQHANLTVGSGELAIAARKETVTGVTNPYDTTPKTFAWTSGRLESTASFSAKSTAYSQVRLSARIWLPAGTGLWPAFWSYGDPWPTQGEIDILEARGNKPFEYETAYWYGRRAGRNLVRGSSRVITSAVDLTADWHVYEVIWSQNALTFLLDGVVVDTKSGGYIPDMFDKQQRLVLNLAVGGDFFGRVAPATIQPGTLRIDWVKVFTK